MEGKANFDPVLGDLDIPAPPPVDKESPAGDLETQAIRIAKDAISLRDNSAPSWLYCVTNSSMGTQLGTDAFLTYRDALLRDAGNPTDPVERMLLEQLALAHFSIGQLRIRSCSTASPQLEVAFSDSATRLLAEFRRCALALEDYRTKRAARTEKRGNSDDAKPVELTKVNGHKRPSVNGNGKRPKLQRVHGGYENGSDSQVVSNANGRTPQWLKNRMSAIPSG